MYRTSAAELQQLTATLQRAVGMWVLVDNSADQAEHAEERKQLAQQHGGFYLAAPGNVGFGAGHNLALTFLREQGNTASYHLIVNPDISFAPGVLTRLEQIFEERPDVGWILPEVRSEEGLVQPLCRLLPTPADLVGRRFLPQVLLDKLGVAPGLELECAVSEPMEQVPFLSGCFIFARRDLLEKVGGFARGYFMYMEDVDLSRRFRKYGKLLYWPEVHVTHGHHRGSYHNVRLTLIHVRSAIRYFNTWGWFTDPERDTINAQALRSARNTDSASRIADSAADERGFEPHSF